MSSSVLTQYKSVPALTVHACLRMSQRRISADDIAEVLQYGRILYANGAVIYIVGRREIEHNQRIADLHHLNGVHVICSHSARVLTVYRDRHFEMKTFRKSARHRCSRRSKCFAF